MRKNSYRETAQGSTKIWDRGSENREGADRLLDDDAESSAVRKLELHLGGFLPFFGDFEERRFFKPKHAGKDVGGKLPDFDVIRGEKPDGVDWG